MSVPKPLKGADMRIQSIRQRYFDFIEPLSLKAVQAYRREEQPRREKTRTGQPAQS